MSKPLVPRLRNSDFLRNNAILFAGSLIVGVLNYAYYPVVGRLLSVEDFGEAQVLISLFLQMVLFLTVLGQVTVNIVANYADAPASRKVIFELEKLGLFVSLGLLALGIALSWYVQEILQLQSVWPFIILLLTLVATVPMTFRSAYLRGQQKFVQVSVSNILGAFGKLAISALLVVLGFSAAGAIGGVFMAQIVTLVYIGMWAKRVGYAKPEGASYFSLPHLRSVLPELKYGLFVLIASLGVTVLSSIDVLVVKHFFDAQTAGAYAGISTVAKILFFLTASVSQVMLPSVKLQALPRENRMFLFKSLALVTAIGGAALLVFLVLPDFVVAVLMGSQYGTYAHLLPMLSLAMFVISLLNVLVFYYVALRKYPIAAIVVAGLFLTCALVMANSSSLDAIVTNLALGSLGMLAMCGLWRGHAWLTQAKVAA